MLFCTSTRRAEHKADVGLVRKLLAGLVLRSKLLKVVEKWILIICKRLN